MGARHDAKIAEAELQSREGRALEAAIAWGQAARWAPHRAAQIEALSGLLRNAELALHQAVWEANQDGASWRMLGHYTDLSWQTLHRRYHTPPMRMRPEPGDAAWRKERAERRRSRQLEEAQRRVRRPRARRRQPTGSGKAAESRYGQAGSHGHEDRAALAVAMLRRIRAVQFNPGPNPAAAGPSGYV
ncbi:MAG TPA: hypothetical protein VFA11_13925 [Acidimicrobiales bacterium]|nr:hypothetical protein [Acidimicrobiales bacterium]